MTIKISNATTMTKKTLCHEHTQITDPSPRSPMPPKRKGSSKVRQDSLFQSLTRWLLHNQIYLSLNFIAILFSTHACIHKARPYTSKFFLLSHYNGNTGEYGVGHDDFFFLGFCIIIFTGLRASCMEYLLEPLARRWGILKKKDIIRFSEQAWLLCYYSAFWTLGVYIYYTSDYFLAPKEMFTNWPSRELPGITKAYILGQWAFWLQQLLVIHIEERRKDHWQMLAHHVITIMLIYTSYALHLTRVANLVLVLMDVVDIFFPLAKCMKYLGFSALRDIMFGFFMLSWFLARHVFYVLNMYHIWTYMPQTITPGCYHMAEDSSIVGPTPLPQKGWLHMFEAFLNPSGTICYSDSIRWGFLGALGFLQALTIVWFSLILQVAIRVVKGIGADDIRSEDEDGSEVEEKTNEYQGDRSLDSNVETINSKTWKLRTGGSASSSGVGLGKELLGRIGCEKH